jgi:hypothetical protein
MKIPKIVFIIFLCLVELGLLAAGLYYSQALALKTKTVNNELIAWQQKSQDIRLLGQDYRQQLPAIELVNKTMPRSDRMIPFFEMIEQMASTSGVTVTLDMPALPQPDTNQNIETALLKVNTKGSLNQIREFVKTLENSEQLIVVRQVILNSPQGLTGPITGNIFIKTFFVLQ